MIISKVALRYSKGFTLIELLIVIVIVGILSTVIIANFIGIRARARDAERKSDLRQIQTALQLYYADYGYYPTDDAGGFTGCGTEFSGASVTYMREIPCDPLGQNNRYTYQTIPTTCNNIAGTNGTTCTQYILYACLENSNDSEIDDTDDDQNCGSGRYSFTVRNP